MHSIDKFTSIIEDAGEIYRNSLHNEKPIKYFSRFYSDNEHSQIHIEINDYTIQCFTDYRTETYIVNDKREDFEFINNLLLELR